MVNLIQSLGIKRTELKRNETRGGGCGVRSDTKAETKERGKWLSCYNGLSLIIEASDTYTSYIIHHTSISRGFRGIIHIYINIQRYHSLGGGE